MFSHFLGLDTLLGIVIFLFGVLYEFNVNFLYGHCGLLCNFGSGLFN